MKLLPDWKDVAKKSWAFWLAIISGGLSAVEVFLPLFMDSMPRGLFAAAAFITAILSSVSRLLYQRSLSKDDAQG